MKIKGFTLIELLAVVIIIGILIAFVTVNINNMVISQNQKAYNTLVDTIENAANLYYSKHRDEVRTAILKNNFSQITLETLFNEGLLTEPIIDPRTNEQISSSKKVNIYITSSFQPASCFEENVCSITLTNNHPVLTTGMIPVYYDDVSGVWKKADSLNTNNQWYHYNSQKWANAVTVTSTNRTSYLNAVVGTTINMSDINTMFVWIPRFSYMIPSGTGPREIKIKFETKSTTKSNGDAINTYYTHPAFTFNNTELSGIWVGKFETTGTITAPTIKPDTTSITNQTVKAMYDSVKTYMQGSPTYGFSTDNDIHMMKNTEWGAITYLYYSKYGKYGNSLYDSNNKNLYMNNSSAYYTGRSMGSPGGSGVLSPTDEYTPTGYYTYDGKCASIYAGLAAPCTSGSIGQILTDKTLSYGASTTGNIYGIYDMSGGAWDCVMGVYKPTTLLDIRDCSGYSSSYAPPITCPSTSPYDSQYENLTINSKYYDRYLNLTPSTAYIKGDATYEVSGWYNAEAWFVYKPNPWFDRGGSYGTGTVGGVFSFNNTTGTAYNNRSFHIVLLSGTGL